MGGYEQYLGWLKSRSRLVLMPVHQSILAKGDTNTALLSWRILAAPAKPLPFKLPEGMNTI